MKVKIRFNTNYPKNSDKKWRVLLPNGNEQDVQHLTNEVEIECKSYTSQDIVKGDDGKDVEKFHISVDANEIIFGENKITIK